MPFHSIYFSLWSFISIIKMALCTSYVKNKILDHWKNSMLESNSNVFDRHKAIFVPYWYFIIPWNSFELSRKGWQKAYSSLYVCLCVRVSGWVNVRKKRIQFSINNILDRILHFYPYWKRITYSHEPKLNFAFNISAGQENFVSF